MCFNVLTVKGGFHPDILFHVCCCDFYLIGRNTLQMTNQCISCSEGCVRCDTKCRY